MEQVHVERINDRFQKLEELASKEFRRAYSDMCVQMEENEGKDIGSEIAQIETRVLNKKIIALFDVVKNAAIEEMVNSGVADYLTQAGWNELQQQVGVPKIDFCKVQVEKIESGPHAQKREQGTKMKSKFEQKISDYDHATAKNKNIAVGGTALAIITVIVPGWQVTTCVLCGVGVAMSAVGCYGVVCSEKEKQKFISKFKNTEQPVSSQKKPSQELKNVVKEITDSQYEHNFKIYCAWLTDIKNKLMSECEKLAAL